MPSLSYLRGLAIGFALAAPIGPVGILCIRRALADGRHAAFIAAMGAAFADAFYGVVAGFGITAVSGLLMTHAFSLRLAGGAFLLLLGGKTWCTPPKPAPEPGCGPGPLKDFLSTFLITLSNPGTILASMSLFATVGIIDTGKPAEVGLLIFGVFSGSTLWWLVLSALASAIRSKLNEDWMRRLNHVSGAVLMLFGAGILGSLAI